MDIKDGINTNIVRTNYLTNPSVGPKSVKTGLWFDPVTKTVKISKNLDVENPVNVVWDEVATKCDIPLRHDVAFFYTEEFRYNFMYPYRYEYPYSYSYGYPYSYSYSYNHYYNYYHKYEYNYGYSYPYPYSYSYGYEYGYDYTYNYRYRYPSSFIYCYTYTGPSEILYHIDISSNTFTYNIPGSTKQVSVPVTSWSYLREKTVNNTTTTTVTGLPEIFEYHYSYKISVDKSEIIPSRTEIVYQYADESTLSVFGPTNFDTITSSKIVSGSTTSEITLATEVAEYYIFAYGYKYAGYSIVKVKRSYSSDSGTKTEVSIVGQAGKEHSLVCGGGVYETYGNGAWWENVFKSTTEFVGQEEFPICGAKLYVSTDISWEENHYLCCGEVTTDITTDITTDLTCAVTSETTVFETDVSFDGGTYEKEVYETSIWSEIIAGKTWNECVSVDAPLPGEDSTENTCELVAANPKTRNVSSIYKMLNPTSSETDSFAISYNIDGVSIEEVDGQYKEIQHLSLYVNNGTWYGDGEQIPSSKNGAKFDIPFLADELDLTQSYYIATKPILEFGKVSSIDPITLIPESELENFVFASPEARFIGAIDFDGEQNFEVIQSQTSDIVFPIKFGVMSPFVLNCKTLDSSDGTMVTYEAKGGIINFNKNNEKKFKFEVPDFSINVSKTQLTTGGYVALEVKYDVSGDEVELVSASPKFFKAGSAKAVKFEAGEEVTSLKAGTFKHWIPLIKIKENSVGKFKITDPEIINYGFLESTLNV